MAIKRPGGGGGGYGPGPKIGAISRQNTAARTYISKTPRTAKQQAAATAAGQRTKAAFKAKRREPILATGAAASLVANAGLASNKKVKPYGPPANKSVQAAAKKAKKK